MKFPILITNFKTYASATGEKALALAKLHEKISMKSGVTIAVAVQAVDLRVIAEQVSIPVFAQHFDPCDPGKNTGYILAESIKAAGASGTLLNHAEHKMDHSTLAEAIVKAKEVGLFTVVCAKDPQEVMEVLQFQPDCIAVEPPELIGGEISVSKAAPHVIRSAINAVPEHMPLIVGAGVRDADDVAIALQHGAKGVLLASGITMAADPERVLLDLISGFKNGVL